MKRIRLRMVGVLMLAVFVAFGLSVAWAEDICKVNISFTPPTHYATDGMCDSQLKPVGPDVVMEFTIMWRIKGTQTWNTIESLTPTAEITGLPFDTTVEVQVGSHYPGKPVLCYSAISEITTDAQPAPGTCSAIQLTTGF